MALPKLLLIKTTLTLTAEVHHQLSLHVPSLLADHVALPHLRTLHKFQRQIPLISFENAREHLMNSILYINTANDVDRIHALGTFRWITTPTYALMIPEIAHPMSSDHIDLLSQPSAHLSFISSLDDESLLGLKPRSVGNILTDVDSVSLAPFEREQKDSAEHRRQAQEHQQQTESLSQEIPQWGNKALLLSTTKDDHTIIILLLPCLTWFHLLGSLMN